MSQAGEKGAGVRLPGAGALLLVAMAGLVVLAVNLHSGEGRAAATSPTPARYDVEWDIQLPENLHPGGTGHIRAEAILTEPSFVGTGPYHDPWYALTITDTDPVVELRSLPVVAPADVADGAEWNLRRIRPGEATIEISLTYKQSWCYPCDTHYYTHTTTRTLTVAPLPGDANCDLATNSIDAALILQLSAAMVSELPCEDAADVNQDGSVNAIDSFLILQLAVRPPDSLSP